MSKHKRNQDNSKRQQPFQQQRAQAFQPVKEAVAGEDGKSSKSGEIKSEKPKRSGKGAKSRKR